MKTQRTILFACAAIACTAMLSGCTKDGFNGHGKAIQFRASAGTATKAAYGILSTDGKTQAIDWAVGDKINIASAEATVQNGTGHVALYKVAEITTPSSAADVKSIGKLELGGANGLMWPDEDPATGYDFFAVYPDLAITEAGLVTASVTNPGTLSGTTTNKYLKADGSATTEGAADVAYTYKVYEPSLAAMPMTAAAHVAKSGNGVTLPFNPAFTALEFNLTSADDDFSVSKVELLGVDADKLAGEFKMTAGNLGSVDPTTAESSIAMVLNDEPLTPNSGVTFTLFMLPKTNTGIIRLKVTTDKGTATLPMTDKDKTSAYQFEAGKKYRINMLKLGGQWKIVIAPILMPWEDGEEVILYI